MTDEPHTMRPEEAFLLLRPITDDLKRLVGEAPCNQAGLNLLMAAHWFGLTAKAMGKGPFDDAREVADLIVETLRTQPHGLRVVK